MFREGMPARRQAATLSSEGSTLGKRRAGSRAAKAGSSLAPVASRMFPSRPRQQPGGLLRAVHPQPLLPAFGPEQAAQGGRRPGHRPPRSPGWPGQHRGGWRPHSGGSPGRAEHPSPPGSAPHQDGHILQAGQLLRPQGVATLTQTWWPHGRQGPGQPAPLSGAAEDQHPHSSYPLGVTIRSRSGGWQRSR